MDPANLYTITIVLALSLMWVGMRAFALTQRIKIVNYRLEAKDREIVEICGRWAQTQAALTQEKMKLKDLAQIEEAYFEVVKNETKEVLAAVTISELGNFSEIPGASFRNISKNEYVNHATQV